MIKFTVYGPFVAKQSTRFYNQKKKDGTSFIRTYTPKEVKYWQERVRNEAIKVMPDKPLTGPIEVGMYFWFQLPKTKIRKDKSKQPKYKDTKPDVENLMKGIHDAIEKIIIVNDSQVAHSDVWKYYATDFPEQVLIEIRELI